jgi:hypothetical protein
MNELKCRKRYKRYKEKVERIINRFNIFVVNTMHDLVGIYIDFFIDSNGLAKQKCRSWAHTQECRANFSLVNPLISCCAVNKFQARAGEVCICVLLWCG